MLITRDEQPSKPKEIEKLGPGATIEQRTRHLCGLLETSMLNGRLRLSFGDYLRLLQWRETKGYDRPAKTIVTWEDPWWLGLIGEMQDRPEIKAILDEFKAKGIKSREPQIEGQR
jgi:hypothetical protein